MCLTYVKPGLHTKTQAFMRAVPRHAPRADSISALRAFLAEPELKETSIRVPLGHREADACLKGGLQRGVPHEVFAVSGHEAAATGFAAGLTIRVAEEKCLLWIRQDFSAREFGELAATGLLELGLDPSRLLLLSVAGAKESLRAAIDALSCVALGAVVIEISGQPKILDLIASRRLALACAQKNVTAILLRFGTEPDASVAETRWLVRAAVSPAVEDWAHPIFHADLVRNRHGRTGNWLMEWCSDEGLFQNPATDIGALLSAPADRQAAAG
jgi:protein ImuA